MGRMRALRRDVWERAGPLGWTGPARKRATPAFETPTTTITTTKSAAYPARPTWRLRRGGVRLEQEYVPGDGNCFYHGMPPPPHPPPPCPCHAVASRERPPPR